MPKNYLLKFKSNNENIDIKYSLIGMGMIANEYPLFYDAMNEKGLFMAGLYFNGYAKYFEKQNDKNNTSRYYNKHIHNSSSNHLFKISTICFYIYHYLL